MLTLFFGLLLNAQKRSIYETTYLELRSRYENKLENDATALPLLKDYLRKAKSENNYEKIFQGYQDAIFYSGNRDIKLKYADSCIASVLKSGNDELISSAYLEKGVIFYFFFKKYQPALNEYLKAYEYSQNIEDNFLRYRIIYHLGVVKSYLGYYNDAIKLFEKSSEHYGALLDTNDHPNVIYNNRKGYLNSIHQLIICYNKLENFQKMDSLITLGISNIESSNEFGLERAYFVKSLGISYYQKKDYKQAISCFDKALPEISRVNDTTTICLIYYYLGRCYDKFKQNKLAISFFLKADSVLVKNDFVVPELRGNYESIIDYYHGNNTEKELYYTKRLLAIDDNLKTDFVNLSDKIHKEYDTKDLLKRQNFLEIKNVYGNFVLVFFVFLIIVLIFVLRKRKIKQKEIQKHYEELLKEISSKEVCYPKDILKSSSLIVKENKIDIPQTVIDDVLRKLDQFEKKRGYTKKGLTQYELAKSFSTNTAYLSQIVNEFKGKKFTTYINELRILYITKEMYNNPKFLDYTIEGLAEKCGISSRQNFTELFLEINHIKPTDFIKQRRKELEGKIDF